MATMLAIQRTNKRSKGIPNDHHLLAVASASNQLADPHDLLTNQ